MRFVLDCSVAISWCMPDENNDYARAVLLFLFQNNEAVVPSFWWLEIINVLLVAERRNRTTEEETAKALVMLKTLPIVVDTKTTSASINATLALGREQGLAAYDTAYIELAIRERLLLATLDRRQAEAARRYGVFLEERTEGEIG